MVGLVAVVALVYVLLWCWPQQMTQGLESADPIKVRELQRAYTATGAQILLGVAVLAGVVLTFMRVRAIQSQAESARI